jgi:ATP-binding cassette subfamily C exporter for protease/lipase
MAQSITQNKPALRQIGLMTVLASFKNVFLGIFILSALINLLMLTPTLYMLQIYDRIMASQSELTLLFSTILVVFFYLIMSVSEWLRSKWLINASIRFDRTLNTHIFNASFDNPAYYAKKNPGQSFSDLIRLRQFLTGHGMVTFFDAPWIPIYISVIFLLHPFLGKVTLIFLSIQLTIAVLGQKLLKHTNESLMEADAKNKEFLFAKLRNAETVEAMGMFPSIYRRWVDVQQHYLARFTQSHNQQHTHQVIIKFMRYAMQSLMLGIAALLVIKGELSAGSMIAANVLSSRALQPMDLLITTWPQMLDAKHAFNKLNLLIKNYAVKDTKHFPKPSGQMSLKNLYAMTEDNERTILDNISIDFLAGQITAIIGPSGSGKTTLARCMLNVWPYTQGSITLDGHAIHAWHTESLRPYLGYLPQDIELIQGSIADNIARFNTPDSDKVIEAAKLVGIHDTILKLPNGYDTHLSEMGMALSGGQKQLLAIARAFYNQPQMIILDEPNSNLDEVGEKTVMEALVNLKSQGKTIFIIAHRLNQLTGIDYILSLKEGKIDQHESYQSVLNRIQRTS